MTKQEFLAMSLSKGLVLQSPYGFRPNGKESTGILGFAYLTGDLYADIENKTFPAEFFPICRPLSDLTKEIEHKGEKFVPMKKIAIYNPNNVEYLIECVVTGLVEYIVLRQLIEWHFDLFGGIENKEAINVNDLKTNPYK